VLIYHNLTSMDAVKALAATRPRASIPELAADVEPLRGKWAQRLRKLQQRFRPGRNVASSLLKKRHF
jgi:hypothetical protein